VLGARPRGDLRRRGYGSAGHPGVAGLP
jgi:hypothetical protein